MLVIIMMMLAMIMMIIRGPRKPSEVLGGSSEVPWSPEEEEEEEKEEEEGAEEVRKNSDTFGHAAAPAHHTHGEVPQLPHSPRGAAAPPRVAGLGEHVLLETAGGLRRAGAQAELRRQRAYRQRRIGRTEYIATTSSPGSRKSSMM